MKVKKITFVTISGMDVCCVGGLYDTRLEEKITRIASDRKQVSPNDYIEMYRVYVGDKLAREICASFLVDVTYEI